MVDQHGLLLTSKVIKKSVGFQKIAVYRLLCGAVKQRNVMVNRCLDRAQHRWANCDLLLPRFNNQTK